MQEKHKTLLQVCISFVVYLLLNSLFSSVIYLWILSPLV